MLVCLLSLTLESSKGALSSWMIPGSLSLFMVAFALGWGPTVWVYLSDIYPSSIKGSCIGFAIMMNWVASGAVVFGLGSLLSQPTLCYSLFFILNLIGLGYVYTSVKETKGTSVENSPIYTGRVREIVGITTTVNPQQTVVSRKMGTAA